MKSTYMVGNNDGSINRIYMDSNGTGQFDQMVVPENGVPVLYMMVGMTWTKKESELTTE